MGPDFCNVGVIDFSDIKDINKPDLGLCPEGIKYFTEKEVEEQIPIPDSVAMVETVTPQKEEIQGGSLNSNTAINNNITPVTSVIPVTPVTGGTAWAA